MTEEQLLALRFPIGKFQKSDAETNLQRNIEDIEALPNLLKASTAGLTTEQVNWIYRPGGWTIKQVVHHIADSHMNSLLRYRWTLTEESPTIMPYDENLWASLPDAMDDDITNTIALIDHLHKKWVVMLKSMTDDQFGREYVHPASGNRLNLFVNTALYAWHGKHHVAHIDQALKYKGNFDYLL